MFWPPSFCVCAAGMISSFLDLFLTREANPRYNKEEKGKAGTCSRIRRDRPGKGRNTVLHMLWETHKGGFPLQRAVSGGHSVHLSAHPRQSGSPQAALRDDGRRGSRRYGTITCVHLLAFGRAACPVLRARPVSLSQQLPGAQGRLVSGGRSAQPSVCQAADA